MQVPPFNIPIKKEARPCKTGTRPECLSYFWTFLAMSMISLPRSFSNLAYTFVVAATKGFFCSAVSSLAFMPALTTSFLNCVSSPAMVLRCSTEKSFAALITRARRSAGSFSMNFLLAITAVADLVLYQRQRNEQQQCHQADQQNLEKQFSVHFWLPRLNDGGSVDGAGELPAKLKRLFVKRG